MTPGPWTVEYDGDLMRIRDPKGFTIALVTGGFDGDSAQGPTTQANAQMLAAAPDLYAALQETRAALAGAMRVIEASEHVEVTFAFVDEMTRLGIPDGIGVRADAALAKAEGR